MGRVNSFGRKKDRKPPTPDAASEDTIPDAIHPPTTPATDELPACTVDFAITLKKVHGRLGLKLTDANLVAGVEAGSGAAVSGMMLGDSLMEVDGVKVSSYAELLPVLQSIPPEGLTVVLRRAVARPLGGADANGTEAPASEADAKGGDEPPSTPSRKQLDQPSSDESIGTTAPAPSHTGTDGANASFAPQPPARPPPAGGSRPKSRVVSIGAPAAAVGSPGGNAIRRSSSINAAADLVKRATSINSRGPSNMVGDPSFRSPTLAKRATSFERKLYHRSSGSTEGGLQQRIRRSLSWNSRQSYTGSQQSTTAEGPTLPTPPVGPPPAKTYRRSLSWNSRRSSAGETQPTAAAVTEPAMDAPKGPVRVEGSLWKRDGRGNKYQKRFFFLQGASRIGSSTFKTPLVFCFDPRPQVGCFATTTQSPNVRRLRLFVADSLLPT